MPKYLSFNGFVTHHTVLQVDCTAAKSWEFDFGKKKVCLGQASDTVQVLDHHLIAICSMTESTSTPHLPWELLDEIVDELGLSDSSRSRDALRNCALACHRFHFRAAGFLFSNIAVTSFAIQPDPHGRMVKRLEDLHHILATNESIAPRVRSFTINIALGSDHGSESSTIEPHARIFSNVHLANILSKLHVLCHFGWINHGARFPWISLSDDIRLALDNIFVCPSLHSLTFEGIVGLSPASIARCNQLDCLRFTEVYPPPITASSPTPGPPSPPSMRLKSLTNFNSLDMFSLLFRQKSIASLCCSQLRDLHVFLNKESEVSFFGVLMQVASKTLEVLDIDDVSHFQYPFLVPGPIDISILEKLHTIKIGTRFSPLNDVEFPTAICGILMSPTTPTMIEKVHIKFDWIDCFEESVERLFIDEPAWETLDGILTKISIYPALKSVEITLRIGYGWAEIGNRVLSSRWMMMVVKSAKIAAGDLLPRVSASGVKLDIVSLIYTYQR